MKHKFSNTCFNNV